MLIKPPWSQWNAKFVFLCYDNLILWKGTYYLLLYLSIHVALDAYKSFYHESNWILGKWVQFGIDSKVILWILIFYPMASFMTVLNAFVHVSWQKNLNNALQ